MQNINILIIEMNKTINRYHGDFVKLLLILLNSKQGQVIDILAYPTKAFKFYCVHNTLNAPLNVQYIYL